MKRNYLIALMLSVLLLLSCHLFIPRGSVNVGETGNGDEQYADLDQVDDGVYLMTSEGVIVVIPPGDSHPDGTPRQISINEIPDAQSALPDGFNQVGQVYQVNAGPEPLRQPAMISLPIPSDVSPDEVIALTTYDSVRESWVFVPAYVNADAGLVTASVPGFSQWSIASIGNISAHCSLYHKGPQCYAQEKGAWIEVTNEHLFNTRINPPISGARYNQYTTNYGVCISSYELDEPAANEMWHHLNGWCLTVSDYSTSRAGLRASMRWLLPAGRYELVEYAFASERNPGVPLYTPVYSTNYRPLATLDLRDGQAASFSNSGNFSSWLGWGKPYFAEQEGISPSVVATAEDDSLNWVGNWSVSFSVESFDCSGEDYYCTNSNLSVAHYEEARHHIRIWETTEELNQYIERENLQRPSGNVLTVEQNYPDYYYNSPVQDHGTSQTHGILYQGKYDPVSDKITGYFEVWHYGEVGEFKITGTFVADRE